MFWPFLEIDGALSYCPLADFGAQDVREGRDVYAKAVVAQPLTGHLALRNAARALGRIVVMERGECDFVTKVLHAQAAGAVAVIVANTRSDGPGAAFVMDAGSRQSAAARVRIPAVMVSPDKAAVVFEQIRASDLDQRECALTIRFLGAQAATQVMEQIERTARETQRRECERQWQLAAELRLSEAAQHLRSRLPACSSAASTSTVSTPSKPSVERSDDEADDDATSSFSGDNNSCSESACSVADSRRASVRDAVTNHWCPMTTALLIMDVQHYFALHKNDRCLAPLARGVKRGRYAHIHSVMVPTIQDVLLASRASEGVEIVYSVVESATRDGRDRSRAHKHAGLHVAKGGFGAQILPCVAPTENDIVIPRTGVNVFESTNLDFTLRNLGVSHVVVLGISTLTSLQVCVQSALDKGYQVTVVREGVTLEPDVCVAEWLDGVERIGCQVLSATAFVRALQAFAYPELEQDDAAMFQC
ncbi:hypothetical protein PybrP1_000450 [[Pythium] brassicae (nom. inval.)]|nr:hypothetical protein PybrP1_000450 [[Pythium] brassicae (nom. inval.)]